MKRIKRWMLLVGLAGSGMVVPACSSMFLDASRDAAVNGLSRYVEEATFQFLDSLFGQPME